MKTYPRNDVNIHLGGWSAKPEYWEEIKQTISDYMGSGFPFKKFDHNYGKGTIVNELYKSKKKNYDYLLTADSDIIFDANHPNLLERCIEAANESEKVKKKPFGILSLNQLGQNCHLPHCVYQNRHKYKGQYGDEEIVWPTGSGGIAGGCLFTNTKCWEAVGGYRLMGVYVGDDAYYLIDAMQKGYTIQMFESGPIVHPLDNDPEYAKWKVKVCQRDSGGRKTNINTQIKEAEEFWKRHGN